MTGFKPNELTVWTPPEEFPYERFHAEFSNWDALSCTRSQISLVRHHNCPPEVLTFVLSKLSRKNVSMEIFAACTSREDCPVKALEYIARLWDGRSTADVFRCMLFHCPEHILGIMVEAYDHDWWVCEMDTTRKIMNHPVMLCMFHRKPKCSEHIRMKYVMKKVNETPIGCVPSYLSQPSSLIPEFAEWLGN